jgi:hypothetical protein
LLSLNSPRSWQTMTSFLNIVAGMLGATFFESRSWGSLRRHHVMAITELMRVTGRATATVNTYLSALKGGAKENSGLTANILEGTSSFDGLQYGDDLVASESDLAHSDLLRVHNQYVGRSLKVNGSFCRDTYILTV